MKSTLPLIEWDKNNHTNYFKHGRTWLNLLDDFDFKHFFIWVFMIKMLLNVHFSIDWVFFVINYITTNVKPY